MDRYGRDCKEAFHRIYIAFNDIHIALFDDRDVFLLGLSTTAFFHSHRL